MQRESPARTRNARLTASELAGLGQFDFDPKLDFGQHRIEAGVAGTGFEVGGGLAQPTHRGSIEIAGQQPDLEVIQHVERAPAALHRALAAFDRVLLDALQRQQRVDIGGRLGRDGRSGSSGADVVSGSEKPVELVRLVFPEGVPRVVPFGP